VSVGQGEDERTCAFDLGIGHLDPISEPSGVRGRLLNLGIDPGSIDSDDAMEERFRSALMAFQRHHDLEPTGALDDATRAKLEEKHDSAD